MPNDRSIGNSSDIGTRGSGEKASLNPLDSFVQWKRECLFQWAEGSPAHHHICELKYRHAELHQCGVCSAIYE